MTESALIGKSLGRYRIVERIGAGGMGEVYRAHDEVLRRDVALKVLSQATSADPDRFRRFEQEARATGALNHPNILAIHDFGTYEGVPYAVTELLEGATLRHLVADRTVTRAKAIAYGAQIARGLAAAHAKGIVHRDLKPENLFVTEDGRVKILDFGIAKLMRNEGSGPGHDATGALTSTEPGILLGTTSYMAPEQIRGEDVDPRTDLFALGAVLYELVSGRRAFHGGTPADTLSAILSQDPAPLSDSAEGVPPDVERAVRRCLEKRRQDRFQTALDLANELERLAEAGVPLGRARSAGVEVTGTRSRRRPTSRLLVALAAVTLVSAVGFGILWLRGWRPGSTGSVPVVAVLPVRNVSDDIAETGYLREAFSEDLVTRLGQVSKLRLLPWMTTQRYASLDLRLEEVGRELGADKLVVGSLRSDGELIHLTVTLVDARTGLQSWSESYEETVDNLLGLQQQVAIGIASHMGLTLSGEDRERLAIATSRNPIAYEFYLRGVDQMQATDPQTMALAAPYFRRALELDPRLAEAHVGLGGIHNALFFGNQSAGERDVEIAAEHFDRALAIKPDLIPALRGRLRHHLFRAEAEECLKIAKRARALETGRVEALLLAGEAYGFAGLSEEAIPVLQRAMALDPANPAAPWSLTYVLAWQGRYQEAIDTGGAYLRRFGEDTEIYYWMAWAADRLGREEVATAMLDRAIEVGGASRDLRADELAAWVHQRNGNHPRARAILERMIVELERRLSAYPDNTRVRSYLLLAHALLGNREIVKSEFERLRPVISRPGYRDQQMTLITLGLVQAGFIDEAGLVMSLIRREGLSGHRTELRVYETMPVLRHPLLRAFVAEGDSALERLYARYRT